MTMRWFGGYVGVHPGDTGWPRPTGARMLWAGRFPFWCAGPWPDSEVRVMRGRTQTALIGPCAAADPTFATRDTQGLATAHAGSYTVIQAAPEEMRVFTDLGFAWPVYLAPYRSGIAWGSSARALAGLTGACPDPVWLAPALVDPAAAEHGVRSPFEGITVAPPGSRVCLRPGRSPVITATAPTRRRSRGAAMAGVRHALDDGIATRIRASSHPSSDLSGLDSGSVCVLAARHVRPPARLTAVTVHPAGRDEGGDIDCARVAIEPGGTTDHQLLPLGPGHLPGTALDQVPATDEPAPSAVTWARLAAELALLAGLGSDCHLTGDGGDTLFHPGPGYLAGLARSGRVLRLTAHSQGWARLQKGSPWPLLAQAIRGSARPVRMPWLTKRAIEMATHDPGRGNAPDQRTLVEIQAVARTARADAQLAEAFGIRLHNPFTDSAVIAAALSVPAWERGDPWHYKPLLTGALDDLLPPQLAARTTKGTFDADHHLGMRANLPALLGLADGHLAALGLIDPGQLRTAIRNAAAGLPTPFGLLEPVLAAESWLRAVATAPAEAWTSGGTALVTQEQS
jgi:asparagine synthase (glutamine-hydrolysing)